MYDALLPAGIACDNISSVRPSLIGVAGLSGSGKTALARELASRLEGCSGVLSLDSYYRAQRDVPLEQRAAVNYDHPGAIDWPLLAVHLTTLVGGEAIEAPHYLFDQHTRAAETHPFEPRPFLILEGILALHHPPIRALLDLKIFVETRPEECLRRRLERDVAERGRTPESVLRQYQETVWPMALEYVVPSRAFADLVVSGEQPIDGAVETVLHRLRPLVEAAGA